MRGLLSFLRRNPLAAIGAALLLLILLAVGLAPLWSLLWPLPSPIAIDIQAKLAPPGAAHWLGTDYFGRDVLARLLHGGQATLAIGLGVVALAFCAGVPFGLLAGYAGGWADLVMMRVVDAMLSFPALVLAIALAAAFGPSLGNAMLAVSITLAPQFARVARAQAQSIAARPYVEAAIALGVRPPRLLLRYILRNGIGPLLVQASLALGSAILQTASLGFLGLGAQPPWPEWGADVSANLAYLRGAPWVVLAPGLAILLAVLSFNLIGDALAEWFNPRRRNAR
ncbi:ABC transporter permease [Roseomonas sp. GC11]|uniref:ABC transporter permease n=1 Tax=Roseomonas sp. GC11 TaxID=2950546 RepID=UPI00210AC6A8|nr:ABC transporter permease [Roseomonas sp. GC11]MCQ4162357.1 ABC transporter permease [Roseomonas sp. GC11]